MWMMSLFKSAAAFIHNRVKEGKQRRRNIKQFRICFWNMYLCVLDSTSQVFNRWAMTLRIVYLHAFFPPLSLCLHWLIVLFIETHLGSAHLVRLAVRAWHIASSCPDQEPHMYTHTHTHTHTTSSPPLHKQQPASIAELNCTENIPEPQVQRLGRDKGFQECFDCISEGIIHIRL